jgi:hypothetical protein
VFINYFKKISKKVYALFGYVKINVIYLQCDNETLTESKHCNYENYSNYTTRKMDGVSSIDSEK